jgi:polysaccharide pyruvyl transferase WcaK-like protein
MQNQKIDSTSINSPKILVVNLSNPLSHGGYAIAISLLKNLQSTFPNAEISLMATRDFDVSIYTEKYGFAPELFVKHTWFRSKNSQFSSLISSMGPAAWSYLKSVSFNVSSRLGLKAESIYQKYDIVLDLSSDSLNEYYGIVYPLFSLFQLELISLCKKKVVVCPASIGPFKSGFMKRLVRRTLSKTDLVIAREQTTLDFLHEIDIPENKLYFAADLAFLFEPISKESAHEIVSSLGLNQMTRPLIGIAPSSEIYRYCFPEISDAHSKYVEYVKLMAEATDFIIEKLQADVVFIPHFVFPDEFVKNDKIASQDIYNQLRNKEHVKLLIDDFRADEVKGVITLCDILVTCRMHAAIAATSSAVPTVALSFGHKFHSVLGKMLGQDKYIVKTDADYSTVLSNLEETVMSCWNNRLLIHKELDTARMVVKKKALSSFDQIATILESQQA